MLYVNKKNIMRKLKYVKLFENFLNEHHLSLDQTSDLSKEDYALLWNKYENEQVDYLKSKKLSQDVINYWTRPDTEEEHQENIQLPWFYNEVITEKFNFSFEEGFFDVRDFYKSISQKTREEREKKWKASIQNGVDFFKGQKVEGETPEERANFLESSTKEYFTKMSEGKNTSKPICVEEPFNDKGSWIIIDGGHRLWSLEKFFPQGLELHMVKVTENKNNLRSTTEK